MSITFRLDKPLPRYNWAYTKCAKCGISNGPEDDQKRYDAAQCIGPDGCYGYGPEHIGSKPEPFSLNVANDNGFFILRDVFNLQDGEVDYCGSIDSTTLALKLAFFTDLEAGIQEPREDQAIRMDENGVSLGVKMTHCGRSLQQIERYLTSLKAMVEQAVEEGCGITWG